MHKVARLERLFYIKLQNNEGSEIKLSRSVETSSKYSPNRVFSELADHYSTGNTSLFPLSSTIVTSPLTVRAPSSCLF